MRILLLHIVLCLSLLSKGQDPQYSQFYAIPSYMNPGFAGTSVEHRFAGNYRHQWPGIPGAFVSYNFAYDNNFEQAKSGFGAYVSHDHAGSGALSFTKLAAQYVYEIKLGRDVYIRPGIEYGVVWRYIDKSRLTFGDELVRGGSFGTLEFVDDQRINYFDLGTGAVLYSRRFWGGISLHHINQPNQSLTGGSSPLPMKFGIQTGMRIPIKDRFGMKNDNYFIPALHYKAQDKFDQLDIGLYFERNPMTFGIWYRGIPVLKAYETGYPNDDALIFLVGLRVDKFKFGYTYDITISPLIDNTNGSHEISIVYEFASLEETLSRSKRRVACPKF